MATETHNLSATLDFISPLDLYKTQKPYRIFSQDLTAHGRPRSNIELENHQGIFIQDIRGREDQFSLDEHGFQPISHTINFNAFDDPARISGEFLDQVEELILNKIPGVKGSYLYDWKIRQERRPKTGPFLASPATTVHTDIDGESIVARVRRHMGGAAEQLLKGRVRMVNFWCPLEHTVHDWPLVVCDGRTVPEPNIFSVDQISDAMTVGVTYVSYSPDLKWYYVSNQTKNEGWLIKSWDTSDKFGAKLCPHGSVATGYQKDEASYHPRESIEVRALVFSDG